MAVIALSTVTSSGSCVAMIASSAVTSGGGYVSLIALSAITTSTSCKTVRIPYLPPYPHCEP